MDLEQPSPRQAYKTCSKPGCPEIVRRGRCTEHQQQHRRATEAPRPSAARRGYDKAHNTLFRPAVLARDPICVCDQPGRHGHAQRCGRPSEHADHYPRSRRELVDLGLDPNDPAFGRGLCQRCHSGETARHQPGGWNAR